MGVLIVGDKPPATSAYNQWKVYRSTTKTGTYSLIATQAITDMTYYDEDGTSSSWYKISYYDSTGDTNESALSDPIMGQSTTYTTVREVESLLQLPTLSDTTNPSVQEVVQVINRVEDKIDYVTGHAWRTRYSNTNSGLAVESDDYEYYDIDGVYEYQTGTPIYLKHRKIKAFDASEGDALQFWTGSEWEDWLSEKTEGRNNDFWVDYERGILYMRGYWYTRKPQGLRLKYRYGEKTVDMGINDIATKMAAIDVLTGMDPRAMIVQEGGVMTHDVRVSRWRNETKENLTRYKEFQVPTMTQ